jgi:hypothetical protein
MDTSRTQVICSALLILFVVLNLGANPAPANPPCTGGSVSCQFDCTNPAFGESIECRSSGMAYDSLDSQKTKRNSTFKCGENYIGADGICTVHKGNCADTSPALEKCDENEPSE